MSADSPAEPTAGAINPRSPPGERRLGLVRASDGRVPASRLRTERQVSGTLARNAVTAPNVVKAGPKTSP